MKTISAKAAAILLLAAAVSFGAGLPAFCYTSVPSGKVSPHEVPGRFVSWNTSEGLPSDKVLFIQEDEEGMIWLCTDRGLCRFDGTVFQNYGDKTSSGPLRDCRTRCVASGPEGMLWVGTESGLERFDKINGVSEVIDAVCGENGKTIAVKSLFIDSDWSLWMHADNGKIIHYNPENQHIESTDFKGAYFEGDYYYDHIFKDRNERIWVGGRATSVAKIENGDIATCTYPIRNPDTEHFEGSAFAEDSRGIFYATDDKGLLSTYDSKNNFFRTFSKIPIAAVCATTDRTGRIWFGGRNGLIRMNKEMDGYNRFTHNPENDKSVASNNIYCLYTDRSGNVWVGTDKGLSVFPDINNAIMGFGMENGLSSDSVTALMQDRDGLLWIGTEENGVDTLNLKNLSFGNLKYELLSGNLTAKTREREWETLRQYALHKAPNDGSLNENKVSALYQDSAGTIYIGLWSHIGFNTFDKESGTFKRHSLWSVPTGYVFPLLLEGNLWGANWYTGFLEDSRGQMWCTTWEGVGLNLFDRDKGEFTGVHFIPGDVPRMPRGTICSHFYDSKNGRIYMAGGKWYGYFDLRTRDFHRYVEKFPEGYPNKDILDSYYAHSPAKQIDIPVNSWDLRILTKSGDWMIVASANSVFKHNVLTDEVQVPNNPAAILEEYRGVGNGGRFSLGGDSLFVQTETGSTIYIKGEDRTIDISRDAPRTLPSRLGSCIAEDQDGFLWYGTTDNGLCRIDTATGEITSFRHEDGLVSGHEDSNEHEDDLLEGLPGNNIRDIFINSYGKIWVGTDKGLCYYDPSGKFVVAKGVGDVSVRRVLEDRRGRLWLSSDNGLIYYDYSDEIATTFHRSDGLRNESYSSAAALLSDGRMAFGGNYGFDIIDPEAMILNSCVTVALDGFKTAGGPQFQCIPQNISLKHRHNSFSVDFSSIFGSGLKKRYCLEGFDRDWNYSDNERVNIRYTNIPGGKYILRAEVLDKSGLWYGREVTIEVEPPVWLRWWFILGVIVLIIIIIVIIFKIRERMLILENIKLSKLVDEKTMQLTKEIESKNKFFSILSHDLRTPIHSLDLLSSVLMDNWTKTQEDDKVKRMTMINSSARRTMTILEDILNWAMSESGLLVAHKQPLVLKDAVDPVVESIEGICAGKNVRIMVEVDPKIKVSADPDMLSTILRNLLSNAIKYSYKDSCVKVSSIVREGKAVVSITDYGIGMTEEIKEKLFRIDAKLSVKGTDGERGSGLGLITVYEFLKKMDEEITVESTPGKGSTFSFTLDVVDFTL